MYTNLVTKPSMQTDVFSAKYIYHRQFQCRRLTECQYKLAQHFYTFSQFNSAIHLWLINTNTSFSYFFWYLWRYNCCIQLLLANVFEFEEENRLLIQISNKIIKITLYLKLNLFKSIINLLTKFLINCYQMRKNSSLSIRISSCNKQ